MHQTQMQKEKFKKIKTSLIYIMWSAKHALPLAYIFLNSKIVQNSHFIYGLKGCIFFQNKYVLWDLQARLT